jgi:hypothetical protein
MHYNSKPKTGNANRKKYVYKTRINKERKMNFVYEINRVQGGHRIKTWLLYESSVVSSVLVGGEGKCDALCYRCMERQVNNVY